MLRRRINRGAWHRRGQRPGEALVYGSVERDLHKERPIQKFFPVHPVPVLGDFLNGFTLENGIDGSNGPVSGNE